MHLMGEGRVAILSFKTFLAFINRLLSTASLHFHFSLSCIGEGHGNPLQCSCLENPRDGGAWQGAVYGVAQSQTRLKRLSSSSTTVLICISLITDEVGHLSYV